MNLTKEKIELATLKGELVALISVFSMYIDNQQSKEYLEEVKLKVKNLELTTSESYSITDYLNFTQEVNKFKNELSDKDKFWWEINGVEVLWKRVYVSTYNKSIDFKTHDDLLKYLYFELKDDIYILTQLDPLSLY